LKERHGETIQAGRSCELEFRDRTGQRSGHHVHTQAVDYKGYTHHATEDEPQYEIKSDKTDHIALHKGSALKKIGAK
jgi:hypothetical protein